MAGELKGNLEMVSLEVVGFEPLHPSTTAAGAEVLREAKGRQRHLVNIQNREYSFLRVNQHISRIRKALYHGSPPSHKTQDSFQKGSTSE